MSVQETDSSTRDASLQISCLEKMIEFGMSIPEKQYQSLEQKVSKLDMNLSDFK